MARLSPIILLALLCQPATAEDPLMDVFAASNLNPLVQAQGLPVTTSASLAAAGKWRWQLQTEFANHFTSSNRGQEAISLDGETHRMTLGFRYGISDRWEAGIDIPYLRHTGGSLDSFIENWHDTFGLPNGGREDVPDDQLDFTYSHSLNNNLPNNNLLNQNVTRLAQLNRSASGIGDIKLLAGYRLREDDHSSWTLRGGVKLPTGDADDLTGSEAGALFVSAHHRDDNLIPHPDWFFEGSIGLAYLADGEVLAHEQENWIAYGSALLAWQVSQRVSLKAQLDIHTAAYDSRLKELGETAAQLIVGGSLRLTDRLLLDISVSEDIITDASPDVVLMVGLRKAL